MQKIQSFIIAKFPEGIVRRLRMLREARDYLRGLAFFVIGAPRYFYPYAAKYFPFIRECKKTVGSTPQEEWGNSFVYYRQATNQSEKKHLVWADTPIPGNYGDWLSPYIFKKFANSPVHHVSQMARPSYAHFVGLGSIISSSSPCAHVIGAGIGRIDENIDVRAKFHSVRGPYTAERIKKLGGPKVETFGDPGFLLPLIYQPTKRIEKTTEILLVRHINHQNYYLPEAEEMVERSILAARPERIEAFIDDIHAAKLVVTSAMHCLITCIAYGVPCILFKPENDEIPVPGDGIKYRDTLAGIGLPEMSPVKLGLDRDFLARVKDIEPYIELMDQTKIESLKTVYNSTSELL